MRAHRGPRRARHPALSNPGEPPESPPAQDPPGQGPQPLPDRRVISAAKVLDDAGVEPVRRPVPDAFGELLVGDRRAAGALLLALAEKQMCKTKQRSDTLSIHISESMYEEFGELEPYNFVDLPKTTHRNVRGSVKVGPHESDRPAEHAPPSQSKSGMGSQPTNRSSRSGAPRPACMTNALRAPASGMGPQYLSCRAAPHASWRGTSVIRDPRRCLFR